MISKIKRYLLLASSTLMFIVPIAVPVAVGAANSTNCGNGIAGDVADGASSVSAEGVDCSQSGQGGTTGIAKIARNIVNIFSFVVGAVAVIMIIYGGFRYITSGGDSNSVGSAKNTLIYAIVGLIIVALSQIIVQFVLTQSNDAVNN